MLVFSSLFSFAQYEPLVVEGAHWYSFFQGLGFDLPLDIIMRGDTIVDGKEYKELYYCQNPAYNNSEQLYALVREDSITKRVYNIPLNNPSAGYQDIMADSCGIGLEQLMFDYSVEVGDTLDFCWLDGEYIDDAVCVVQSIEYEDVNYNSGLIKKTFTLMIDAEYIRNDGTIDMYTVSIKFYEGLGTKNGPVLPEVSNNLISQLQFDNYEINPNLTCLDVEYDPNLDAISNVFTSNSVKAFPSPASEILHIETDKFVNNGSYKLSTITGQVMKARQFSGHHAEVTVNELPTGIYFIQIFDKTQLLAVGKVLVK